MAYFIDVVPQVVICFFVLLLFFFSIVFLFLVFWRDWFRFAKHTFVT